MRTWDQACVIHVLRFMCAMWKVLWVLVVTLSLVSCSVSPRRRNTKCRVLSFWILWSTYALAVRLHSVIVNFICSQIIAHLHRENGSFEVLSLQQNHVWIQDFRRSNRKITMLGKSEYLFVVGRSCQEMCGAILWVDEQNDSTTLQSINSMPWRPSFQRRRKRNPCENYQKYALKLFRNACSLHVLEDPIFYGQWTNLHDQLQNGPKIVTNDHLVWSLTFITEANTNNIVLRETLQNSADWDCFKTPILQEILRTQNPLLEEHCAFSEVTHLFQ